MRLLEEIDYFIRIVPLPWEIRGMTATNPDGTFSIYLNSRNTYGQNQKAKQHELDHIENEDFYSNKLIYEIEDL